MARTGFTLVELIVALPIAALVASVAVFLLLQQGRSVRSTIAHSSAIRELRHARMVLASELAPLASGDITAVSDSLIEFKALLGTATVCGVAAENELLLSVDPTGLDSTWIGGVRAGDAISLWPWPANVTQEPKRVQVMAVDNAQLAGVKRCAEVPNTQVWRITVSSALSSLRLYGSPARIQRLVRYSHYRSGSSWWLGRKTWRPSGWDVIQPVIGPLNSFASHGFSITPVATTQPAASTSNSASYSARSSVSDPISDPIVSLKFRLIAPRQFSVFGNAASDTSEFEIALHGAALVPANEQ